MGYAVRTPAPLRVSSTVTHWSWKRRGSDPLAPRRPGQWVPGRRAAAAAESANADAVLCGFDESPARSARCVEPRSYGLLSPGCVALARARATDRMRWLLVSAAARVNSALASA